MTRLRQLCPGVDYVIERVGEYLESGLNNDEILILYRRSKMFFPYRNALRQRGLKVDTKTIHAAKGLEARIVFILGLTDEAAAFLIYGSMILYSER